MSFCYDYKGNSLKSKDDLVNCLDVCDALQELYEHWLRKDDFYFWLEAILEVEIHNLLVKTVTNDSQCSEFWRVIFSDDEHILKKVEKLISNGKSEKNPISNGDGSGSAIYKAIEYLEGDGILPLTDNGRDDLANQGVKKSKSTAKVKTKKGGSVSEINLNDKKVPDLKEKTESIDKKKIKKNKKRVSQKKTTNRYSLFRGKNVYFGESVCELEKLSDGCFRSKKKVSDSNEELRTLLRSGELFVTDWQGGYFKCGEIKKDDSNKLIVRCGETSGIGFASKVEETKSGRKTQQGQKIKHNEEGIKCSVVPPRKESFLEKLKNGILDFCEVYNQYIDPGDVYVP